MTLLKKIIEKYKELDTDLGLIPNAIHSIPLKTEFNLSCKPFRIPLKLKPAMKNEIKRLLDLGIIVPSKSIISSPAFPIQKAYGSIRLIVDYRRLNELTLRDSFPFPYITQILDQLQGMRYFTQLDMRNGYHQVAIKKEDQYKTSFVTDEGQFEYKRMPFGLSGAPATFQRIVCELLENIDGTFVFLDDILLATREIEEHKILLIKVLKIL